LRHDIESKNVIDLGSGTGILAYGALYFNCKTLTAVEQDPDQKSVLEANLSEYENKSIIIDDVRSISGKWDTVLCNGPFGSVVKDADLPFLEKAFSIGDVVYMIHNWKAKDFVLSYASERCSEISYEKRTLSIPRMYGHHEKDRMSIDILFLVCRI
jgi:Predicted RNA methylase